MDKPQKIPCPQCQTRSWDRGRRERDRPGGTCDQCRSKRSERCNQCKFDLCVLCLYDGNPPKEEKREREREQVKFKIVKKVKCPGCSRVSWDGGRREVHVPHGICDKCGERRAERCLHCKYDLCHRCLFNGTKVACPRCSAKDWDGGVRAKQKRGHCDKDHCKERRADRCKRCNYDLCRKCLYDHVVVKGMCPRCLENGLWDNGRYHKRKRGKCEMARKSMNGKERGGGMSDGETLCRKPAVERCQGCNFDICGSCLFQSEPPRKDQVEKTEQQKISCKEEELSNLCDVCFERPKNATIIHGYTGHVSCCLICALEVKERFGCCPVCQEKIDFVVRVYH